MLCSFNGRGKKAPFMPNTITQFLSPRAVHFPYFNVIVRGATKKKHPEQNPTQRETLCTIIQCLQPHRHHQPRHSTTKGGSHQYRQAQKDEKRAPKKRSEASETKNLSQTFLSRSTDKVLQPRKFGFSLFMCKYAIPKSSNNGAREMK